MPTRVAARLACAALAALTLGGCGPVGSPAAGPGGRPQSLALTPEQEYRLGVEAYREVLRQSEVVPAGPTVARVRQVGQRIVEAATGSSRMSRLLRREINLRTEGYTFGWEFNVLRDDRANAFCLPGGKVAVYSGLFRVTGGDDGLLAVVLGHEIAHALAHHASERLARASMTGPALQALESGFGAPGERDRLLGLLGAGARLSGLAFDRRQESEADHIGTFLMTFAGYPPEAAVEFWGRMAASAGGLRPPEILSDHPSDARRVAQLRGWVEQARAARQAFEQGRVVPEL